MEEAGGKEILPSFWSDNYFSLLPGESRTVTWSGEKQISPQESFNLRLEGWNVPMKIIALNRGT
jgi:hypothetical protein